MRLEYPFIPTQQQWEGWLADPVTQFFQKVLLNRREDIKEQLAIGRADNHAVPTCQLILGLTHPDDTTYEHFVESEIYHYGTSVPEGDDDVGAS